MMILTVLIFILLLVCSSIDIREFLDFKCSLSQNLVDFIKPAVIKHITPARSHCHKLFESKTNIIIIQL